MIYATYSGGEERVIAQIPYTEFDNSNGLKKEEGLYSETNLSGVFSGIGIGLNEFNLMLKHKKYFLSYS